MDSDTAMSSTDNTKPQESSLSMMLVLTGIAMLSGFLVVLAAQLSAPLIAENQRRAIEKALAQVIPGIISHQAFQIRDGRIVTDNESTNTRTLYAGYDADGRLIGIAARAAAQGYAGTISLIYGYAPDCECIRGIQVLKMAETPGLGDKIIKDSTFQANFEALDAHLNPEQGALAHAIVTVKHGSKQQPWQIDAISGATISSKAVGKALNQSAQDLLPLLQPLLAQLRQRTPALETSP